MLKPPDYLSPAGAKVELSDSNGDTALSSALRLHLSSFLLTVENPRIKHDPSSYYILLEVGSMIGSFCMTFRGQNCQTMSKLLQPLFVSSSIKMLPQQNLAALCNNLLPKPICFASFSSWTVSFRRFIYTLHGLVAVTQWKWAQPVQLLAQRAFISQARQGTFRL